MNHSCSPCFTDKETEHREVGHGARLHSHTAKSSSTGGPESSACWERPSCGMRGSQLQALPLNPCPRPKRFPGTFLLTHLPWLPIACQEEHTLLVWSSGYFDLPTPRAQLLPLPHISELQPYSPSFLLSGPLQQVLSACDLLCPLPAMLFPSGCFDVPGDLSSSPVSSGRTLASSTGQALHQPASQCFPVGFTPPL